MIRMFVRHDVTDYAKWRAVYDGFDQKRSRMGVRAQAVYQAADEATDVTVTHDFDDLPSAQAFASAPRLKEVMGEAGVAGAPQIWFTSPS